MFLYSLPVHELTSESVFSILYQQSAPLEQLTIGLVIVKVSLLVYSLDNADPNFPNISNYRKRLKKNKSE